MKLKVARSCGNELVLCLVVGCRGRDVDSSCFRGETLGSRRRSKLDICFSPKADFFPLIKVLPCSAPVLNCLLSPLSVWKYTPCGNPSKTFRKPEKPVLSASWQRYTTSGHYQKVDRSIGQRIFSSADPHHEITLHLLLKVLWIFLPPGKKHRCTKVTSHLRMAGFYRIPLVVSKELPTFSNSNKQRTNWGVIFS